MIVILPIVNHIKVHGVTRCHSSIVLVFTSPYFLHSSIFNGQDTTPIIRQHSPSQYFKP